jgi:hypothetical protein
VAKPGTSTSPVQTPKLSEREKIAFVRARPDIWLEAFGRILNKSRDLIAPRLNVLQRRMVEAYLWCREHAMPCRMIILKPRQKGCSTGSAGIAYTHLRNFNTAAVFIGDEYVTTDRLIDIFNRYAKHDAFNAWQSLYDPVKRKFTNGSILEKETAGDKNAGRGGTFQLILGSEVAHWPSDGVRSAQQILLSLLQVQPMLPNTLTILESTPNGPSGEYYDRWQGARSIAEMEAGDLGSGYIRIFAAWFEFEDSELVVTEKQREEIIHSLTEKERVLQEKYKVTIEQLAWRRGMIGNTVKDEKEFDQEYPTDPESCFIASGNPRFSLEGIHRQERIAIHSEPEIGILEKQPDSQHVLFVPTGKNEAVFERYEKPRHQCDYIGALDMATGASQTAGARNPDGSAAQIWRKGYVDRAGEEFPLRMVLGFHDNVIRMDPDLVYDQIALASEHYGWCIFAPEINNSTGTIEALRGRGVPIYRRRRWDRIKSDFETKYGWQTTEASRRDMIDNLAKWIRQTDEEGHPVMECASKRWIGQLKNFVVKPSGKAEAKDGCHDDEILCSAIAIKCLDQATTYDDPDDSMSPDKTLREIMKLQSRGMFHGAEV